MFKVTLLIFLALVGASAVLGSKSGRIIYANGFGYRVPHRVGYVRNGYNSPVLTNFYRPVPVHFGNTNRGPIMSSPSPDTPAPMLVTPESLPILPLPVPALPEPAPTLPDLPSTSSAPLVPSLEPLPAQTPAQSPAQSSAQPQSPAPAESQPGTVPLTLNSSVASLTSSETPLTPSEAPLTPPEPSAVAPANLPNLAPLTSTQQPTLNVSEPSTALLVSTSTPATSVASANPTELTDNSQNQPIFSFIENLES